ncbi:MAG: hypothetical protein GWN76_11215, partial [candidate division Zixibacteria bacterium]|nr:hypothetical protein [candidate division Zixibacteria bacterium]NIU14556.1 hypothetical protein [candidate division Zixibacteria bacterium]
MKTNLYKTIYYTVLTAALSLLLASPAVSGKSIDNQKVSINIEIDRVIVKFREQHNIRYLNGSLVSPSADLTSIEAAIRAESGKSIKPLFIRDQAEIDNERLRLQSEKGLSLPDLNSYYQVELSDYETARDL